MTLAPCSNCGSRHLRSTIADAAGGYGPDLLPGASGWFVSAKFTVVVCCNCGLTRFFAHPEALEKIADSASWDRADVSG